MQGPTISPGEIEARHDKVHAFLAAEGLGALMAYSPAHEHWWSNTGHVSYLSGWSNRDRIIETIMAASGTEYGGGGTLCWHVWIVGAGTQTSRNSEKLASGFAENRQFICYGAPAIQKSVEIYAAKPLIHRFHMSQHNSFKKEGADLKKRNVLKRFERVALLKKRGQWKEGDRVTSLIKTKPED